MSDSKGYLPPAKTIKRSSLSSSLQVMRMLHPNVEGVQRMAEGLERATSPSPSVPTVDRKCTNCEEEEISRKEQHPVEVAAKTNAADPPEISPPPTSPTPPPEINRVCQDCEEEISREEDKVEKESKELAGSVGAAGEDISRSCTNCAEELDMKGPGVSSPGEPAEVEADSVAKALVGIVNFDSAGESDAGHQLVRNINQRRSGGGGGPAVSDAFYAQLQSRQGKGVPLSGDLQERLQGLMGVVFDEVRIHTDSAAAAMAAEINARAFAWGGDIYFANGEFAPETERGFELLLHELVHVVQRGGGIMCKEGKMKGLVGFPSLSDWKDGKYTYYLLIQETKAYSVLYIPYLEDLGENEVLADAISSILMVSQEEAHRIIKTEKIAWRHDYEDVPLHLQESGFPIKGIRFPNKYLERTLLEDEEYGHNKYFDQPFEELYHFFEEFVVLFNKAEYAFGNPETSMDNARQVYEGISEEYKAKAFELAASSRATAAKIAQADPKHRLFYIYDLWANAMGLKVEPYSESWALDLATDITLGIWTFGAYNTGKFLWNELFPPDEDMTTMRPAFVDRIKWTMVRKNREFLFEGEDKEAETSYFEIQQLADQTIISINQHRSEFLRTDNVDLMNSLKRRILPYEDLIWKKALCNLLDEDFAHDFNRLAEDIYEEGHHQIGYHFHHSFRGWEKDKEVARVRELGEKGENRSVEENREYLLLFYQCTFALAFVMGFRTDKRRGNLAFYKDASPEAQRDFSRRLELEQSTDPAAAEALATMKKWTSAENYIQNKKVESYAESVMETGKLGRDLLGFLHLHPDAIKVNAHFYPQEQINQFRLYNPTGEPEKGGQPIRLYLYFEPDPIEEGQETNPLAGTPQEKGTWHLVDFTDRLRRAENKAEGVRGYIPTIALFKQLDHKMRFPEGALYFRMPDESSYRILKTNGDMEWYDWLRWIGIALTLAAMVVTSGGTILAIAGAVLCAVATAGEMVDKEKHGLATPASRFIDAMDIVGSLAAAAGGAAKLAINAGAMAKLGQAGMKAVNTIQHVVKVAEVGSDAFNLVLMGVQAHETLRTMATDGTDGWTIARTMALYIGMGTIQVIGLKDGFGELGDINGGKHLELSLDRKNNVLRLGETDPQVRGGDSHLNNRGDSHGRGNGRVDGSGGNRNKRSRGDGRKRNETPDRQPVTRKRKPVNTENRSQPDQETVTHTTQTGPSHHSQRLKRNAEEFSDYLVKTPEELPLRKWQDDLELDSRMDAPQTKPKELYIDEKGRLREREVETARQPNPKKKENPDHYPRPLTTTKPGYESPRRKPRKRRKKRHICKHDKNRRRFRLLASRLGHFASKSDVEQMLEFWCEANRIILGKYPTREPAITKKATIKAFFHSGWSIVLEGCLEKLQDVQQSRAIDPAAKHHLVRYFERYEEYGIFGYASLKKNEFDMAIAKQNLLTKNFNFHYHKINDGNTSKLPTNMLSFYDQSLQIKEAIFKKDMSNPKARIRRDEFVKLKSSPQKIWSVVKITARDANGDPANIDLVENKWFSPTNDPRHKMNNVPVSEVDKVFKRGWKSNFAVFQFWHGGQAIKEHQPPLVAVSGEGKKFSYTLSSGESGTTLENELWSHEAFDIKRTHALEYSQETTGHDKGRHHDSEVKMAGYLTERRRAGDYSKYGQMDVVLYTDRISCESCTDVLYMLQQRFNQSNPDHIKNVHIIYTDLSYY